MNRITRNASPACLATKIKGQPIFVRKGKTWMLDYQQHKIATRFAWGTFKGSRRADLICKALGEISDQHCFYCDAKWVRKGNIEPEIDHFCPKTIRPILAYYYPNLFLSCGSCNRYKASNYDFQHLLKVDEVSYHFDNYFFIDYTSGKIRVRPDISLVERYKARYSLTVFGINKDARPESRLMELKAYDDSVNKALIDYSYRFYISRN